MEAAMNESSHGEEQSDAAIQLEFQMDCHARRAGLAMAEPVSSLAGAKPVRRAQGPEPAEGRRSNPARWIATVRFAHLAKTKSQIS